MPQPKTPLSATPGKDLLATNPLHKPRPYFCRRSEQELSGIDGVVAYIKEPLTPERDRQQARVYVIEVKGSNHIKVGWTNRKRLVRMEEHSRKCKIAIHRMYITPVFFGSHKAEQIILKLHDDCRYKLYCCPCKGESSSTHTEWVLKPYEEVVMTVQLVCNWIQQQSPYGAVNVSKRSSEPPESERRDQLKLVWSESLVDWHETQRTQTPLSWQEFFWRDELHWRGYPIPSSPRRNGSNSMSPRTPKCVTDPVGHFYNTAVDETYEYVDSLKTTTELSKELQVDGAMYKVAAKMQTESSRAFRATNRRVSSVGDQDQYNVSPYPSGKKSKGSMLAPDNVKRNLWPTNQADLSDRQDTAAVDGNNQFKDVVTDLSTTSETERRANEDAIKNEHVETQRWRDIEAYQENHEDSDDADSDDADSDDADSDDADTEDADTENGTKKYLDVIGHHPIKEENNESDGAESVTDGGQDTSTTRSRSPVSQTEDVEEDDYDDDADDSKDGDYVPHPPSRASTWTAGLKKVAGGTSRGARSFVSTLLKASSTTFKVGSKSNTSSRPSDNAGKLKTSNDESKVSVAHATTARSKTRRHVTGTT